MQAIRVTAIRHVAEESLLSRSRRPEKANQPHDNDSRACTPRLGDEKAIEAGWRIIRRTLLDISAEWPGEMPSKVDAARCATWQDLGEE